jgi:hypothetical protein
VGCHANLNTVSSLRILAYDVHFGGFGCLLYPKLKSKPMYKMVLFGHVVCVRSGLSLTPVDDCHHRRSKTRRKTLFFGDCLIYCGRNRRKASPFCWCFDLVLFHGPWSCRLYSWLLSRRKVFVEMEAAPLFSQQHGGNF